MKAKSPFLLEIVIISFNTSSLLKNCLQSLFNCLEKESLNPKTRVTVVDNNSRDDSISMMKKFFKSVNLIENKENSGFAKANNQAISAADAPYILLLNSDTLVHKNAVSSLLDFLVKNPQITAIGPKLLNSDGSRQQSIGYAPVFFKIFCWMFFLDDIPLLSRIIRPYHLQEDYFYSQIREVDWVTGAALMFKHEIVTSAGMLDERIFMYGEEVEWCFRIRKNGGKIVYFPEAEITHLGSGSQKTPGTGIIREYESINYFYSKYFPHFLWPVRLMLKCGALLRLVLFGIIKADSSKFHLYAKAFKVA